MSSVDYEALEQEEIEAISEEEHQRRLRTFTERLATKLGLLAEAQAEIIRQHLLLALERRQLTTTEADRARIAAAADRALLDRWYQRAFSASTVADVYREDE